MSDLSSYLTFSNGRTSPKKIDNGNYPIFGANGIIGYSNESNAEGNTIIIGRVGAYCGSVHFSNTKCWVTDNAISVSCNEKAESSFWFYYLKFLNLNNMKTGSGQPLLNQTILKSINVDDQIASLDRIFIGNKLSELDQKIQLNTQINQTLEQIAQMIFKSWFIDFDPVKVKAEAKAQGATDEQANIAAMSVISGKSPDQLNAHKQTKPTDYQQLLDLAQAFPSEFEEIDGVEVPKGWGIEKIEDVIQKIPVGKKYSQKNVFEEGDIPVLDQGKSGIIGYHNDKAGVSASANNPVIVFANHTCYMRLISYPFSAIQNVFAFKGKEVDVFWLYLATLGKQEFTEYKGHFPDFLIKQIVVPNKEMTFLFSQFISENFMKNFSNDEENKHLSKLRDLLLPKLLSGEV